MKKKLVSVLLVVAMALSLVACGGTEEGSSEGAGKDTVTVASSREPSSLIPYDATDSGSTYYFSLIYDRLLNVDEESNLTAGLAESWEEIDDTHFRFVLRDDVTFHNGEKMTAEDVLYTFEKNSTSSATATYFGSVDIANSVIEDENTVVIALSQPYPAFLRCCAMELSSIVCKSAMEADPEGYAANPVGTGAFKFTEWASGDYITLEANEDWWGGDINFKELRVRYIPEATTRAVEVQSGGVDIAHVTVGDVETLESNDKVVVGAQPIYNTAYVSFNCSVEPFDNPKVRQAISLAIDTDAVVKAAYFGKAETSHSFVPPTVEGYFDADSEYEGYDVEKAKQLLVEAGYPDGFSCEMVSNARQAEAEMIQAYLAEIGIDVKLNVTDFSNWLDAIVNGKQQMYIGGWTILSGDVSEAFAAFHSKNFGAGGNRSFYANDEVDALVDIIDTETDKEKRLAACEELQQILADECVTIGLEVGTSFYSHSTSIDGFKLLPSQSAVYTGITFTE